VIPLKILNTQAKRKGAIAPNFQPIIVYGYAHGSTSVRIISVAEGVDKCLTKSSSWKKRLVDAFKQPRLNSSSHWKMSLKEKHSFIKELKSVTLDLSIIEKFCFVNSFEARHSKLALRILWQKAPSKKHHSCVDYLPVDAESHFFEDVPDILACGLRQPASRNARSHGSQNLFVVQLAYVNHIRLRIFPPVPTMNAS